MCLSQGRARELREERRTDIGQVHRALLEVVSDHFRMDKNAVEDYVIDTPDVPFLFICLFLYSSVLGFICFYIYLY